VTGVQTCALPICVSAISGAVTIMAMAVALPDDLHEPQDAYPVTSGLWVGPCAPL
jgi:hypothetical protein